MYEKIRTNIDKEKEEKKLLKVEDSDLELLNQLYADDFKIYNKLKGVKQ